MFLNDIFFKDAYNHNMNKLLVILGPTATGKTDLALKLAKKFEGEIVSADSRQIYKELDIGTGKAPSGECKVKSEKCKVGKGKGWWVVDEIKIWMYDVVNPKKQYNVSLFAKDATKVIGDIHKRGKLPILVGGTGLYIKAVTEGLSNLTIPTDKKLRKNLEKLALDKLQKKLQEISKEKWENLNESDRQNPRRLIRTIELSIGVKRRGNLLRIEKIASLISRNDVLKIGLTAPREILYQRVNEGVIRRLNQGMIDEAINLCKGGLSLKRMKQLGLEYGILADLLSGKVNQEGLTAILQGKIHGVARRQLTWFRKEKNVNWFDITEKNYSGKVEKLIAKWYYS